MSKPLEEHERAAMAALSGVALRDVQQPLDGADFLLAWWNAAECGGFDLTDLWGVDAAIAADMLTVFALLTMHHSYPDTLGYGQQFAALVRACFTATPTDYA